MSALYSEWDSYAAEWCGNLITDGHVAPGIVDTRSVTDIQPWELMMCTQAHFYAGVGGWSAALRLARWPDERPIWSMSLPCQPFSSAGKQKGFDDERHLWPTSYQHILACRPGVVVGEQVASKDGRAWLDVVQADMEAAGYAFWAVVLPVAGFGAPGERHRIFWLAYADDSGRSARLAPAETVGHGRSADPSCGDDRMAYAAPVGRGESGAIGSGLRCRDGAEGQSAGLVPRCAPERVGDTVGTGSTQQFRERGAPFEAACPDTGQAAERAGSSDDRSRLLGCGLADASDSGHDGCGDIGGRRSESPDRRTHERPHALNGFWRSADWLFCTDGKWRPVECGYEPLAHGLPRGMGAISPRLAGLAMVAGCDALSLKRAKRYRVGSLRGYGNAINVEVAAEWIRTWMDDLP